MYLLKTIKRTFITWEAEAGGWRVQGQPGLNLVSKTKKSKKHEKQKRKKELLQLNNRKNGQRI
jgi:hypothetical protein